MSKNGRLDKFETDPKTVRVVPNHPKQNRCPICPPGKGENGRRRPRRGEQKPKYKNKR